jgi:hypothetical protein
MFILSLDPSLLNCLACLLTPFSALFKMLPWIFPENDSCTVHSTGFSLARSSCTSSHHSSHAPLHSMPIHISSARSSCNSSQYSSHAPLHSMSSLFIHISSARSSCTSSHHSYHEPLHSMLIHSHFLSTLLMHLLSVFFSCTSHSMPIHSHFISTLRMHLLLPFFSCTSP